MLESLQGSKLLHLWNVFRERADTWGIWEYHDQTTCAGLDIGASFARLININSTKKPFLIENCLFHPLPAGAIVKNEIKEPAKVVTVLKALLADSGLSSNAIAMAVPRALAIVKSIAIDGRLTPDEVQSRAWIEANRHFPDLVGNIYLDFSVMGPMPQDPSRLELVLVACRKDQVDPWLSVLKQAGFDVKMVDLNCYAMERALVLTERSEPAQMIALLNLNFTLSSLVVMHEHRLQHAHDQDFDSQRLVNQVAAFMKDKETLPEAALLADNSYKTILKENLVSHLRHVMHFFFSTQPDCPIQKIFLSGDCAAIPGLCLFVEEEIGIKTELANPFKNMTFSSKVDQEAIQKHAPEFMLCCGLGLSQKANL